MLKKVLKNIVISIITLEARLVLRKYKPKIVAITGSVGKTTTKDAITAVLEKNFFVRGSQKSLNSAEFGVALTVLGCESGWSSAFKWSKIILEGVFLILFRNHYPKWLVLEVGLDRPGDIQSITTWLKPDVTVVTRIGKVPVHVEFFDSREQLIAEKAYLVAALKKDGIAVLNADDKDVIAMSKQAPDATLVSFGYEGRALINASRPEINYTDEGVPEGLSSQVTYQGRMLPLQIHESVNEAAMSAALAAFSVAVALDLNLVTTVETLAQITPTSGRSRILKGINGATLIDDSYNASPTAVFAALKSLGKVQVEGRRIAVLGDMLELGKYSAEEHKNMGIHAAETADVLVTVGLRSEFAGEEAQRLGMYREDIYHFKDSRSAGAFLKTYVEKDDVVLIKGSQGLRMERVVEMVLGEGEKKSTLLVRQDKEWQKRS